MVWNFIFRFELKVVSFLLKYQFLAFAGHRLDLLVREVLQLAVAAVLALQEVEVVTREEVQLVLHLPDLRFFDFGLGDGQRVGLAFCLPQM